MSQIDKVRRYNRKRRSARYGMTDGIVGLAFIFGAAINEGTKSGTAFLAIIGALMLFVAWKGFTGRNLPDTPNKDRMGEAVTEDLESINNGELPRNVSRRTRDIISRDWP